jgi:integrase
MNVYQRYLDHGDKTYYGRFTAIDPEKPGETKRYLRKLEATSKTEALAECRKLQKLINSGRFDLADATKLRHDRTATLGEIFTLYKKNAQCRERVAKNNVLALRSLIRHGIAAHRESDDETIDALDAAILTDSLMRDFQQSLRKSAGGDNLKENTAIITANSIRRQARSVFKPDIMSCYKSLNLPELAPFLSVKPLKEPTKKFKMPERSLIETIRAKAMDLKTADPNAYRIYLLAFGAGLRKKEIGFSRWNWIEKVEAKKTTQYSVRIQTTEDYRLKSDESERVVPLETSVFTELAALRIPVIGGGVEYILGGNKTERLDDAFRRFSSWLQGLGWTRRKKAHELRKCFGSLVNEQAGISAAQDLLGHASISTTKEYYVAAVDRPKIRIFG